MTNDCSIREVEKYVEMLPDVSSVSLFRSKSDLKITAKVRCNHLAGFDAIARCAAGANVIVTLGHSDSNKLRQLEPVSGLNCQITFDDNASERPSECEAFGYFATNFLYNASIVDDNILDYLEPIWNSSFIRNAG